MNKYECTEEFLKNSNSSYLPKLFNTLNSKKENAIFLMPRDVLILFHELAEKSDQLDFLKKCCSFNQYFLEPESFDYADTIYLVEDTLSSGYRLFRVYCTLKSLDNNKKINSIVYSLSTEFPRNSLNERMYKIYCEVNGFDYSQASNDVKQKARDMWRNFKASLSCCRYFNQENTSLFNIDTVKLRQKNCSYFSSALYSLRGSKNNFFSISYSNFDKIKNSNSEWKYFPINTGEELKDVFAPNTKLGFFEYHGQAAEKLCGSVLQNIIILCKYIERTSENNIKVLFSPFVISRSCPQKEFISMFSKISGDDFEKEKSDKNNFLKNAFYSSISSLEYWVGNRFKSFLQREDVDISDIMCSPSYFMSAKPAEKKYQNLILDYLKEEQYHWIEKNEPDEKIRNCIDFKDSFRKIKNKIAFNENHNKVLTSICELENEMTRTQLTASIVLLLETNMCDWCISLCNDLISFALLPCKNIDLFLSESERLCHIFSDVLYISNGLEEYSKQADSFYDYMEKYFKENNVFKNGASQAEFEDYLKIIQTTPKEDVKYKIMGKRFLTRNLEENDKFLFNMQNTAIKISEEHYG